MARPVITSISPDNGLTPGGGVFTITGTDLDDLDEVMFGEALTSPVTHINSTTAEVIHPAHAAGDVHVSRRSSASELPRAEVAWPFSTTTSLSCIITPLVEPGEDLAEYLMAFKFQGGGGYAPVEGSFGLVSRVSSSPAEFDVKGISLSFGGASLMSVRFGGGNVPYPNPHGAANGLWQFGPSTSGTHIEQRVPFEWEAGNSYKLELNKAGTFTENYGGRFWELTITDLGTSTVISNYAAIGVVEAQGDIVPDDCAIYINTISPNSNAADQDHAAAEFTNLKANSGATSPTSITANTAPNGPYTTSSTVSGGIRLDSMVPFSAPEFTYIDNTPTVTDVSPTSGPTAGTTSVTITGTRFTGATSVKFGATNATSYLVNSSTSITAVAPAHAAGEVDVTVTTGDGTSATGLSAKYTFVAPPPPTVTGLSPDTDTSDGGETITITGTNFTGATSVKFGTTSATFSVVNSTTITATAPARAVSTVDVTVVTPDGTSATSADSKFDYTEPPPIPTVTSLLPRFGSTAGGNTVTITGRNLDTATAVSFGASAATSFSIFSPTTIFATVPLHITGEVDVTVTSGEGTSDTGDSSKYEFITPVLPTVTRLSPASGTSSGGTVVTIVGTELSTTTAVSFGGTPATSFTLVNSKTVRAVAPSGTGEIDVTVTAIGGTSATGDSSKYLYTAPPSTPTITNLSVSTGTTLGTTLVTITGSNLDGATAIRFGTTNALLYTLVDDSTITVTAPVHNSGEIDVRVVTPGGTSATSSASKFTYAAPDAPGGGLAPIAPPPPIPATRARDHRVLLYDETMGNSPEVFTLATRIQANDPTNDVGSISFVLPYLDSTPASDHAAGGKIIQVQTRRQSDGAYVPSYLGRLEAWNRKTIAPDRAQRTRSISCRGLGSDFEKSKIYPHGGVNRIPWSDVRTFGWAAPELDTTSWPAAHQRAVQGLHTAVPPMGLAGFPYTWPNPLTYWLWGMPPTDGTHDRDGINYFQYRFSTSMELDVTFYVTADDLFVAALDGVHIVDFREGPGDAADSTYYRKLKIPAGDHCFAVKAENLPRPGNVDNTGIINVCATYDIAPGDPLFTGGLNTRRYLFTSVGVNVNSPQLATELQVWKANPYPTEPPGMSPGQIISILFTEAQARGELRGWSLDFDVLTDSNDAPWINAPDFSMSVGDSVLQCLDKLVSDGWIDWAVDPASMTLKMWVQGTRSGSAPSAVYAEGVNIKTLDHDEKWGGKRDKLLLRWEDGFTEMGTGEFGDFLAVSDAPDITEAKRRGQINIDRLDDDSTGIVMTGQPLNDAQTPWIGFTNGSSIPVPGPDGVTAEYIVTSIGLDEEAGPGRGSWTVQLVSRRRAAEDRLAKIAVRAVPGGLNGRTDSVVSASKSQPSGGVLEMDELKYNLPGVALSADTAAIAEGFSEARSGPDRVTRRLKLQRVTLEADGGTTGSSIVDFYINGHLAISMFLFNTLLYTVDYFGSGSGNWFLEVDPSQTLTVRLRNNPGDHSGMVLRVSGTPLP